VIPSGEDALLPLSDAPRTYRLYFSPLQSVYPREYWEELQGGTPPHLVLAFDLLGFDPDCATSATLSLHTVSLYTIDLNNL